MVFTFPDTNFSDEPIVQDKIPGADKWCKGESQHHDDRHNTEVSGNGHFPPWWSLRAVLAKKCFEAVQFTRLRLTVRQRRDSFLPFSVESRSIESIALGGAGE